MQPQVCPSGSPICGGHLPHRDCPYIMPLYSAKSVYMCACVCMHLCVCVCECVCVCISVCEGVCMCVHLCECVCMCASVCMCVSVHLYVCECVCMCICVFVWVHECVCVCVCVCVCMCVCVCVCVCVCTDGIPVSSRPLQLSPFYWPHSLCPPKCRTEASLLLSPQGPCVWRNICEVHCDYMWV